ncbi:unnamed protein product [Amoebophrya sp. A25]|nr:unnamed protein product [Amoebophrya sp. A25]|eukprot:GSA25T00013198001.1
MSSSLIEVVASSATSSEDASVLSVQTPRSLAEKCPTPTTAGSASASTVSAPSALSKLLHVVAGQSSPLAKRRKPDIGNLKDLTTGDLQHAPKALSTGTTDSATTKSTSSSSKNSVVDSLLRVQNFLSAKPDPLAGVDKALGREEGSSSSGAASSSVVEIERVDEGRGAVGLCRAQAASVGQNAASLGVSEEAKIFQGIKMPGGAPSCDAATANHGTTLKLRGSCTGDDRSTSAAAPGGLFDFKKENIINVMTSDEEDSDDDVDNDDDNEDMKDGEEDHGGRDDEESDSDSDAEALELLTKTLRATERGSKLLDEIMKAANIENLMQEDDEVEDASDIKTDQMKGIKGGGDDSDSTRRKETKSVDGAGASKEQVVNNAASSGKMVEMQVGLGVFDVNGAVPADLNIPTVTVPAPEVSGADIQLPPRK